MPPDERFEWESITPPRYTSSPMQASLDEVAFDNDNNEKVIITVETQNHIIDVDDTPAQIGPSSFVHPDYLLAPVVGEQQATWYDTAGLAKSTGDAPGTTFQDSSMQGIFSEFFHFIDSNPLLNDSFHAAKEKVASYPIVVASTARRTNPATLKCDICQATFTRSHNLGCKFLSFAIDCQLILPAQTTRILILGSKGTLPSAARSSVRRQDPSVTKALVPSVKRSRAL